MKRKDKVKIIFTRGMQASGKTSWAKEFVKENQNYKRISRDDLRHMLTNYTFTSANEDLVTKIERDLMLSLIDQDFNLIIDKMNLNAEDFKSDLTYINSICDEGFEYEVKEFAVALQTAIERDSKREFSLGDKVLKRTWNKYELVLKEMIERNKPKYKFNEELPNAVIFDCDGTLCINNHRRVFDFTKVYDDQICLIVAEQINFHKSLNRKIVIVSGREDICKNDTIRWFNKYNLHFDEIYMRKEKDYRKDVIIKQEIYNLYLKDKYNILCVYDDRLQVIRGWKELGLFVFNVGDNEEF